MMRNRNWMQECKKNANANEDVAKS
jgi:hypothetical protein